MSYQVRSASAVLGITWRATTASDWKFVGHLCTGDADTGAMWECPLLSKLQSHRPKPGARTNKRPSSSNGESEPVSIDSQLQQLSLQTSPAAVAAADTNEPDRTCVWLLFVSRCTFLWWCCRSTYFFCISPDAPTNPVLYWLGHLDDEDVFHFDTETAPTRLDLGDIVYAPNLMEDENGETLLWAWLQERRTVGSYDYAGCLSIPRKLTLHKGRLFQQPADRIDQLRSECEWKAEHVSRLDRAISTSSGRVSAGGSLSGRPDSDRERQRSGHRHGTGV